MKRIGITGPTGAGKTTALQALVELDAHIIDADAVYHALLESSAPLRAALTVRFGPSILDGEGRVNRKALGGVVFGDPAALADLNAITHRFILAEYVPSISNPQPLSDFPTARRHLRPSESSMSTKLSRSVART